MSKITFEVTGENVSDPIFSGKMGVTINVDKIGEEIPPNMVMMHAKCALKALWKHMCTKYEDTYGEKYEAEAELTVESRSE